VSHPSLTKKQNKKVKGDILSSLIIVMVAISALLAVNFYLNSRFTIGVKETKSTLHTIEVQNGIETLVVAIRQEESKYTNQLVANNCVTANPLYKALKEGHQCKNNMGAPIANFSVSLFLGSPGPVWQDAYSFNSAHPIFAIGYDRCVNCFDALQAVVLVGANQSVPIDPDSPVAGISYSFFLLQSSIEKQLMEFAGKKIGTDGKEVKFQFSVKSALSNAAHIDWEGRVLQEKSDPYDPCELEAWDVYKVFNKQKKSCDVFSQIGSGNGVHFHQGRYFGFRPFDGKIIDMSAISSGATDYDVEPNGTVQGLGQIHPSYFPDMLINADDLTIIQNQIYFVRGTGDAAAIYVHQPTGGNQVICNLGTKGFAQSFTGLGALNWSDRLDNSDLPAGAYDPSAPVFATFFLKTDTGDLFFANVTRAGGSSEYKCSILKDASMAKDEYKRTLGFDRMSSEKPYVVQ